MKIGFWSLFLLLLYFHSKSFTLDSLHFSDYFIPGTFTGKYFLTFNIGKKQPEQSNSVVLSIK